MAPDGVRADVTITYQKCTHGNKVTVHFADGSFVFHSQWLHDARCGDGSARNAITAFCQQSTETVHVTDIEISGHGLLGNLDVTWDDGVSGKFPLSWLRVVAPLVAASEDLKPIPATPQIGWTVETLKIPEISYNSLFGKDIPQDQLSQTILSTLDIILANQNSGIVKIIDLPPPCLEDEHNHRNNLVTQVLKRLFGSVWVHPVRGADQTFNISSHRRDAARGVDLPNYDTTQVLLPHSDHAFYDNPIQVQGFYGLEGTSENTFVSSIKALQTLKQESPEAYEHLCLAPMTLGRVSRFYGDALYQATVDTAITMQPGSRDQVKRVRWHPNLTGYLLSSYDRYKADLLAHQKFQEIMRRESHQLKIVLKPGDLYVWDNFRMLHGRESVLDVPRTGVGQTVPEGVVNDRYRALALSDGLLTGHIGEDWLVHLPVPQLREISKIMKMA